MTLDLPIAFNRPFLTGKECDYVHQAFSYGKVSGDGMFTKKCHEFFQKKYGFPKVLLTTSCTDALEMTSILLGISPGDEVIVPSFTFSSTANAFLLRGANIRFVDSSKDSPNMDISQIEPLITKKTKVIIPVHYAGVACDMDYLMALAGEYNLCVVEDAAHAIDSYYKDVPLGRIGDFGTFSFHESKNLSSGEGGMLAINEMCHNLRAEIIREKGTNRTQFFEKKISKYSWVDIGSSYLPSDITALFLYAQLEMLQTIQEKRLLLWHTYFEGLTPLAEAEYCKLPHIPFYATHNAHLFYIVCRSEEERSQLISFLQSEGVSSVFHYQSLHRSSFYQDKYDGKELPNSDIYSNCLLRLPLYYSLSIEEVYYIIEKLHHFYLQKPRRSLRESLQKHWVKRDDTEILHGLSTDRSD